MKEEILIVENKETYNKKTEKNIVSKTQKAHKLSILVFFFFSFFLLIVSFLS